MKNLLVLGCLLAILGCSKTVEVSHPPITTKDVEAWNDFFAQSVLEDHLETLSKPFDLNKNRPAPEALWQASHQRSVEATKKHSDSFVLGTFNYAHPKLKQIYIASVRETVWAIEQNRTVRIPVFGLIRGVRVEVDEHFGLPTFPMGCVVEEAKSAEIAGITDTLDWYFRRGIQLPGSVSLMICKEVPVSLKWTPLDCVSGGASLEWAEVSPEGDAHLGAFATPKSWRYHLQLEQASFNFTRGFRPPEAWAYDSQSKTVWFRGWIDGALGYQDSLIVQIDPITGAILATFPWSSDRPKPDPLINFDTPPNSPPATRRLTPDARRRAERP